MLLIHRLVPLPNTRSPYPWSSGIVLIGFGRCFDGVFDEPGGMADGLGGAPVEAEGVFIEIALQVLGTEGAVMGAEQPAFGEGENKVDGRQAQPGIAPALAEIDGFMCIACASEAAIAGPAVGHNGERLGGACGEELFEICRTGVDDHLQAEPPKRMSPANAGLGFDGTGNQALPAAPRPGGADFAASMKVSSTSTRLCSGSRSDRIMARRILCSQLHRPSRGSRSDPCKGRGQ